MNVEEKAKQLGQKYFPNELNIWARCNIEAKKVEFACLEMAEWKDSQLKPTLMRFFKYLDKRGFLDPELQCDPEHQIDTFLEQFNNDVEID